MYIINTHLFGFILSGTKSMSPGTNALDIYILVWGNKFTGRTKFTFIYPAMRIWNQCLTNMLNLVNG